MSDLSNKVTKSTYVWTVPTGPLHDHVPINLNWLKVIPTGRGTKYQRERLIQSIKELLDALIGQGGENGALAAGSIFNDFNGLRRITKWMTANGIWTFRDIRPSDIISYVASRQAGRDELLCTNSVQAIQFLFRKMWLLRDKYLMPLKFDPLVVDAELKLSVPTRKLEPWKHLDEELALPLVKDALDWIDINGRVVIDMVRKIWNERRSHVGLKKVQSVPRVRKLYLDLLKEPAIQKLARQLGLEDAMPDSAVARIVTTTEGACMVVLLFMVGMRASELIRLDTDSLTQIGEDGLNQRNVLRGFAAKRRGMPRTWAVSEEVTRVVLFLVELYAEARVNSGQNALFLNKPPGAPIPLPGRKTGRISSSVLPHRLHAFVNSPHRGLRGTIHLHAHMCRKTFARFVVMRDKSALESLAYHYGHVHSAITDGTYVGSDISLAKLIDEEDRRDLAEALMDLLTSGSIGGRAGKKLVQGFKNPPLKNFSFRGKRSLTSTVEKLIKDGIVLAPCDWGYCVYSKAMSACGGDDKGPNTLQRAPDICATCNNFSVTKKHQPYWNARLKRDEELLTRMDISEQTRQIVSIRSAHSKEVLASLIAKNSRVRTNEK